VAAVAVCAVLAWAPVQGRHLVEFLPGYVGWWFSWPPGRTCIYRRHHGVTHHLAGREIRRSPLPQFLRFIRRGLDDDWRLRHSATDVNLASAGHGLPGNWHARRTRAEAGMTRWLWSALLAGLWLACRRWSACGALVRFGSVAVGVALLGGCVSVVRGPSPAGPPTGGGNPTADPVELADFAVRQAYEEFWWVASRLDQQPPARWRGVLSVVAVDPELDRQLAQARDRAAGGVHRVGEVITHVTAVRGAMSTRAVLLDCLDASRAGEADDNTGRTTSTGLAATPIAATLLRTGQFAPWRVSDIGYPVGRCVVDARPGGVPGAPPSPAAEIPRHENGTPRRRGQ
jgi:hypothetical protein